VTPDTIADLELLRDLFARFDADPQWIPAAAREITDAIHAELPELEIDDELRVSTFVGSHSVLRLLADMIGLRRPPSEAQPPPAAVEYAREFVRRGVTIDTLLRTYHVGHATFFRNIVVLVDREVIDPGQAKRAIEAAANWTFDYVQALNRGLVARYGEERVAWIRSAAAIRSETLRALLAEDPIDPQTAGERLGYNLDRRHVAFVVWLSDDATAVKDLASLERVAFDLARSLGGAQALVVPLGARLVAGWIPLGDSLAAPGAGSSIRLGIGSHEPILAAVGTAARGVAGFCDSHRDALNARRVAQLAGRRAGSVTRYEDVALTALTSVDLELARRFVTAELGPLAAQDDDTLRLTATLRVYLEERGSPRRAAERLGVHENTIKARVRTINELLGHPCGERVGELLVALRLAPLTHADSAGS
jgi:hypothetical protein